MSGIIVDGVGYTTAQVRRLILERHELASALAVARSEAKATASSVATLRDTLRLRSDALNRTAEENDRLRAAIKVIDDSRSGW